MDNHLFELQTSVTRETPRQLRHALEAVLKESALHASTAQHMLLCLSEYVTNLLLHAQPTPSQIRITFSRGAHGWLLDIFDNSRAWDPTENLNDDLLTEFSEIEQGRGIALLHAQSDKISYIPGCYVQGGRYVKGNKPNQLRLLWRYPKQNKQQTILIVEDNNSLRLLYKTYLTDTFNVVTAANGYQAIEQLKTEQIDLVLSDIKMPLMNGLSLRKKINQHSSCELIPFIFLTGEEDEIVQEQAAELGIDDYLIKPVNKPQLLKIIQRVIGRSTQVYQRLTERIDKRISASLKPRLPENSHGWRLQAASRNTGSGGGDLLLHKRFEGKTQLLLSDIMGHDDSAKFFSHAYGGYLHGLIQSMHTSCGPAQLLEQLSNCAMHDQLLSQVTLTCCSVQLSSGGNISVASAGHPAPLLISPQKITTLKTAGILPGLLADAHYKNTELTVNQGERIALYTDGLFESANSNETRIRLQTLITKALLDTLHIPIAQALQQVMKLFDEITGSQPSDDALLLLIEPIES
ncbi:SpoIIE family protein phosphatase [Psychromonas aquimarina]|uniref:SpoIIE family protein phosphatase n=1 Tax=Psychromonas aquimarina TaxID=444919 RepID=UPI0003F4B6D8|nr:SpoIIE family protein phosphatase [Psychromonas aquimarina]